MIPRNVTDSLLSALSDSPVVLLNGPRQAGKSTLVQWLVENRYPARYITLDDAGVLAAARNNPSGFLSGIDGPVALDEVQRAPELFLAIKAIVNSKRTPGKFLLTGSVNVLLLPRISESLAGRMEILTLWPFAQRELEGRAGSFIDAVFSASLPGYTKSRETKQSLIRRVILGGYPEVQERRTSERRDAWFRSYITTILQRDVRDIANIEGLTVLPRLLALLAARSGGLLNYADIATGVGLPQSTLKRYMSLLQTTFLVQPIPAWFTSMSKRLIKTPKLYISDTGLMAHLLNADEQRLSSDEALFGKLLENFVVMEFLKQVTWSRVKPSVCYFRTAAGHETDIILERPDGSIVGIEVKSGASVTGSDVKTLRLLADELGKRFHRGVVLYTGSEVIPFEKKLTALPMSVLWT